MTKEQAYIPGMCNINKAEVAYRKKAMWFGIIISIVSLTLMLLIGMPAPFRLLLFIPIFIAAIGYLQVRNKFCVAYGAKGRQNATDGSDVAADVIDDKAVASDKRKAKEMNRTALIATILILIPILFIPNF